MSDLGIQEDRAGGSGRGIRVEGRGRRRCAAPPRLLEEGLSGASRGLSPFVCSGRRWLPALALGVCLGPPVWV